MKRILFVLILLCAVPLWAQVPDSIHGALKGTSPSYLDSAAIPAIQVLRGLGIGTGTRKGIFYIHDTSSTTGFPGYPAYPLETWFTSNSDSFGTHGWWLNRNDMTTALCFVYADSGKPRWITAIDAGSHNLILVAKPSQIPGHHTTRDLLGFIPRDVSDVGYVDVAIDTALRFNEMHYDGTGGKKTIVTGDYIKFIAGLIQGGPSGSFSFAALTTSGGNGNLVLSADNAVYINYGGTQSNGGIHIYDGGGTNERVTMPSAGGITLASGAAAYTSGAPNGGTAAAWKLGTVVSTTGLVPSTTTYIQVDVGGTLYKLATIP